MTDRPYKEIDFSTLLTPKPEPKLERPTMEELADLLTRVHQDDTKLNMLTTGTSESVEHMIARLAFHSIGTHDD